MPTLVEICMNTQLNVFTFSQVVGCAGAAAQVGEARKHLANENNMALEAPIMTSSMFLLPF